MHNRRLSSRSLGSWVDGYLEYTDGVSSPSIFRKWAAIVTVGASLERRAWAVTARGYTFPNLFVILAGRPGIGKSEAINRARSLVAASAQEGVYQPACNLAPVDVTKSALYDYLASSKVKRMGPAPEEMALGIEGDHHYHSAFLAVSELQDLVRDHDTALLGALHSLYDCLPMITEERRYRADNPIKIPRGQVSLLGGTTPAYIGRTFPAAAWDEGFMARTIIIYSADLIEPDLFGGDGISDGLDTDLAAQLVGDLRLIGRLNGRFEFTDDAKATIVAWQKSGQMPKPTHPKLEHYCTRRMRHVIKLAMVASASRSDDMTIHVEDFQEALGWMHEAESQMPKIFLEIVGKSDSQVLNELYHFTKGLWEFPTTKGQSIRRGQIVNFLRNKVPAMQIDKIIDIAVEAELLIKMPTSTGEIRFRPNEKAGLFNAKKMG